MRVNMVNKIFFRITIIFFALIITVYQACGNDSSGDESEKVFVKKIVIKGNLKTAPEIIKERITIKENRVYDLDTILEEINISRRNILSTGLFSDVFFNDIVDESGNLEIYIELTEKQFLKLVPSGFVYLDKGKAHFHSLLQFSNLNFMGNKSLIEIDAALYDSRGIALKYVSSQLRNITVHTELGYLDSTHYSNEFYYISPSLHYAVSDVLNVGLALELGKAGGLYTGFKPLLKLNTNNIRLNNSVSLIFAPLVFLNQNEKYGYLVSFEGKYSKRLILQIRNNLYTSVSFSRGTVPERRAIISRARGYDPFNYSGNYRFSITEELSMPFIFNYNLEVGAFFDGDIIGSDKADILIGGGLILRWYHSILNPLYVDVSLGKGLMLNFASRF